MASDDSDTLVSNSLSIWSAMWSWWWNNSNTPSIDHFVWFYTSNSDVIDDSPDTLTKDILVSTMWTVFLNNCHALSSNQFEFVCWLAYLFLNNFDTLLIGAFVALVTFLDVTFSLLHFVGVSVGFKMVQGFSPDGLSSGVATDLFDCWFLDHSL
jgi:hypothetical protein